MDKKDKKEAVFEWIRKWQADRDVMPSLSNIAVNALDCPIDRVRNGGLQLAKHYVQKLENEGRIEITRINKVKIL